MRKQRRLKRLGSKKAPTCANGSFQGSDVSFGGGSLLPRYGSVNVKSGTMSVTPFALRLPKAPPLSLTCAWIQVEIFWCCDTMMTHVLLLSCQGPQVQTEGQKGWQDQGFFWQEKICLMVLHQPEPWIIAPCVPLNFVTNNLLLRVL